MTEQEWLTSTDTRAMLKVFGVPPRHRSEAVKASDRKLRLFACACCRALPADLRGLPGQLPLRACDLAERVADGLGQLSEIEEYILPEYVLRPDAPDAARAFVDPTVPGYDGPLRAALLRCIFGNPWKPVFWHGKVDPKFATDELHPPTTLPLSLLTWNDGTVRRLAEAIYQDHAWGHVPILADALEEAGCNNETILQHLRATVPCEPPMGKPSCFNGHTVCAEFDTSSGIMLKVPGSDRCPYCNGTGRMLAVHARGCWVVDLLTGRG